MRRGLHRIWQRLAGSDGTGIALALLGLTGSLLAWSLFSLGH